MARRTKREIMAGVDCTESHFIDHNTVEYWRENGDRVIRLHDTDIVTFKPNGRVILNTGGWNTITTRDRINKQLAKHCAGWRMWSEKNEPYLGYGSTWRWNEETLKSERTGNPVYHFHDGIVIYGNRVSCDGKPYDKEQVKKSNAWQRRVKRYARAFVEKLQGGEIPPPGPGDCWPCSMVDQKGRAWGESGHDDHVYAHIIEKYYVPSLVVRATKQFGVSQCAQWCLAAVWGEQNEQAKEFLESSLKPHGFGGIGWEQIHNAISRYCIQWAPYDEATIKRLEEEA